jgi:hypothetical protein
MVLDNAVPMVASYRWENWKCPSSIRHLFMEMVKQTHPLFIEMVNVMMSVAKK